MPSHQKTRLRVSNTGRGDSDLGKVRCTFMWHRALHEWSDGQALHRYLRGQTSVVWSDEWALEELRSERALERARQLKVYRAMSDSKSRQYEKKSSTEILVLAFD